MFRFKFIGGIIENYRTLISNFSYLFILQVFNLLLPFLTFWYLIRVLGPEVYGLTVLAQSLVAYFVIFINFGFNISATKDIAIFRSNQSLISEITSSVLFIKFALLLISMIIVGVISITIPSVRAHADLYLLSFGVCVYEAFFPVWYFQGVEKMKYITFLSVFSKLIFTLLIFSFVQSEEDFLLVPLFNSIGGIFAVIFSFYLLSVKEKIRFKKPSKTKILYLTKRSMPFFFSRSAIVFISKTNMILIGYFLGLKEVAYFDFSSKIVEILKLPFNLINQAVYPHITISKNFKMVWNLIKINLIYSLIVLLLLPILSDPLIKLVGGQEMLSAKWVFYMLLITVPLSGVSYFLGNTMLVVKGYSKEFNHSILYQVFLYVFLVGLIFLANWQTILVYASIIVICSIFELVYRLIYVKKYNIV